MGVLLCGGLSFIATLFLPWWTIVIICALVALILKFKIKSAFLTGFLGIFLLWLVQSFLLNSQNDGLLAAKVGQVLQGLQPILLMIITGLIGGIFGGLGAQIGAEINKYLQNK